MSNVLRIHNGERIVSWIYVIKTEYSLAKKWNWTFNLQLWKNQLNLISDLNVRPEITKLLEENIAQTLFVTGLTSDLFGYDKKSIGNKSDNKKAGLQQTKSSSTSMEATSKTKEQPME